MVFIVQIILNGSNRDFKKLNYGALLQCLAAPKYHLSGTSRGKITSGMIAPLFGGTTFGADAAIMMKGYFI